MATEWTFPPKPFSDKKKLIVGVSGGADSLGLLLLLLEELHLPPRNLVVAHVNYGLRGRDSDLDEALARRICHERNVPFEFLKVSRFRQKVKKKKQSPQDLAREIRYSFFQKLAKKHHAWGVAVAHHLEDQAETVLDRLLRGAGARGLSGLRPVQLLSLGGKGTPLKVWRPLLHYLPEKIRNYLKGRNIVWREDRSNQQSQYRRNQIRNQILPFLSKWNPKLSEILGHVGEVTAAEDLVMDGLIKPLEKKLKSRRSQRSYFCDAARFRSIPVALQRRWIRHAAEKLTAKARGLSFERIEEVIRLWEAREPGPRDVGFGLAAGRTSKEAFLRWKG
jgi:tRNA(Ile)-lysidine synthase